MKSVLFLVGLVLGATLTLQGVNVGAYDLITHAKISQNAYDQSTGVRQYIEDVSLDPTKIFDPSGARGSGTTDFTNFFRNSGTLRDWLTAGAIREDDFMPHATCDQSPNPPSDIDRSLHHFFDVQDRGQGLTVLGFQRGFPAPDWALGRQGRGSSATQNQFSILDARAYQLKSLIESKKEDRDRNAALLFRTLGQVAHVLQDMGQPQHTRNDPHAGCFPEFLTGEHSWYEDYIEKRARGEGFRTRGQLAPPLLLNGYAPPRFTVYQDFWTTVGQQGLADFSSRNFFSAGTNFSDFSLFGSCGGLTEPVCDPFNPKFYTQRATPFSFQTVDGKTIAGTVTLFLGNVQDRLTGQTVSDVALSSRSVWDQHLESRGFFPRFSLNTINYDSMSDVLLPRAVGYSAGLLDYFFRGKLDVDLISDPDFSDPTVVKLSGTNGSPDKLDGGTLSLYADDPATGERSPVPALDPNFTVVADPGQPVESAKFQINAETERFLAVYKGKLGEEKPEGDFPGGVIGKVLGGVRAESIFVQGDKRMLRTVDGVFPFPPTADRLQNIQWGDLDNTFVGILPNPSNPNIPDQVLAFKINRPVGSAEKPPLEGPEGAVVSAGVLKAVNFPFDLSLGVTVNYSLSARFQEYVIINEFVNEAIFDGSLPCCDPYRFSFVERKSPTEAEVVLDQTFPLTQSFPIVLDLAHLLGGPSGFGPRPYFWGLVEVGFDSQGRLLALVRVGLTAPENNVQTINLKKHDFKCNLVEDPFQPRNVFINFQGVRGNLLWALIDVEKREVLGVTSSSTISLSSKVADSSSLVETRSKITFFGGEQDGLVELHCSEVLSQFLQPNPNFTDVVETGSIRIPEGGLLSVSVVGQFRDDLKPLVTVSPGIGTNTRDFEEPRLYFVDFGTKTNRSIRERSTSSFLTGTLTIPIQAQTIRPTRGTTPELLALFGQNVRNLNGALQRQDNLLVRWSPQLSSNTSLALTEKLPPASGFYSLRVTTSQAAFLEFNEIGTGRSSTLIADFANKETQAFPGQFLTFDYVLLDPKFLYNINDTKFHTLDPLLRPTALPRRLADAPQVFFPPPAFHLIQLR